VLAVSGLRALVRLAVAADTCNQPQVTPGTALLAGAGYLQCSQVSTSAPTIDADGIMLPTSDFPLISRPHSSVVTCDYPNSRQAWPAGYYQVELNRCAVGFAAGSFLTLGSRLS
jgi:hypothetical protein